MNSLEDKIAELNDEIIALKELKISSLQKEIHSIAVEKGWWIGERNDGEIIALIHSELSEALEALRSKNPEDNNLGEELADTVIRVMDYCEARNINLEHEILKKMKKNKLREARHGKNF